MYSSQKFKSVNKLYMRFLSSLAISGIFVMHCINLYSETIPATIIPNTLVDVNYNLTTDTSITGETWQAVCEAIGLPPTDLPGGYWCLNNANNPVYVQTNNICADGFDYTSDKFRTMPNPYIYLP